MLPGRPERKRKRKRKRKQSLAVWAADRRRFSICAPRGNGFSSIPRVLPGRPPPRLATQIRPVLFPSHTRHAGAR
jgi:hypothetical protein